MTVKVRSCKHFFQVIYCTHYQRSSSAKGRLPLKVVFRQRSSSVKGCLPSKISFHQRLSSIEGCLPLLSRKSFLGFSPEYGIAQLSLSLFVSSSWSTSMTSISRLHFQTPLAISGPPGHHFGFCRQCDIEGGAALQAASECPRHCLAGIHLYLMKTKYETQNNVFFQAQCIIPFSYQ